MRIFVCGQGKRGTGEATYIKLMLNGKRWWQARVYAEGQQRASKLFPWGPKGGPAWREAKAWEEDQKAAFLAGAKIFSDCEIFSRWLEQYLLSCQTMTKKTFEEKKMVLSDFADYCLNRGINNPEQISARVVHLFLRGIFE